MKKRLFVLPFALLILIMAVAFPASADTPSSIRVYLRRLQVEDTLRVTVKGQYATQDGRLSFSDDAKLVVVLRGDQLVLHTGQTAVVMGSSIKLVRCQSETPGYLLLNDGTGMYEGDLSLDIVENAIRPILTINVEDYLLGVVPFEMGDSSRSKRSRHKPSLPGRMRCAKAVPPTHTTWKIPQTIRRIAAERRPARFPSRP